MNKVIIKSREGDLTADMFNKGVIFMNYFKLDLASCKYGDGWDSCHYQSGDFHAITKLNKSGSITITVHKE